jgi:ubiquinone/menaquinone biosynthesis C-methylase UbiE
MSDKPNAQYNMAKADSLSIRVATRVRHQIFRDFMAVAAPRESDEVLDLGVTSDEAYASSNYFEALYPYPHRITAAGIDDATFLEARYPGLRFVFADACNLQFADGAFDIVHSSAVLEHVGSLERQATMVAECLRVARRVVCLTTPNRWYPIEFHTQLPLVHWLPKPWGRAVMRRMKLGFFAEEANLNLMSRGELAAIMAAHPGWRFRFLPVRLLGLVSNLVLIAERK